MLLGKLAALYDEIDLEDFSWSSATRTFYYPCPCGDRFFIALVRDATRDCSRECVPLTPFPTQVDLLDGEDIAPCPSCSLRVRVIFADVDALEARVAAEEQRATAGDEASTR